MQCISSSQCTPPDGCTPATCTGGTCRTTSACTGGSYCSGTTCVLPQQCYFVNYVIGSGSASDPYMYIGTVTPTSSPGCAAGYYTPGTAVEFAVCPDECDGSGSGYTDEGISDSTGAIQCPAPGPCSGEYYTYVGDGTDTVTTWVYQ